MDGVKGTLLGQVRGIFDLIVSTKYVKIFKTKRVKKEGLRLLLFDSFF